MRVYSINPTIHANNSTKKTTKNKQMQSSYVNFKQNFSSCLNKVSVYNINNVKEATNIFNELFSLAKREGRIIRERAVYELDPKWALSTRVKWFKKLDLPYGTEVITDREGEGLLVANYGVEFKDPNNSKKFLHFDVDSESRIIVSSPYAEACFHSNGNLRKFTKCYELDSHPETTYYNEDGTKSFWKNILF